MAIPKVAECEDAADAVGVVGGEGREVDYRHCGLGGWRNGEGVLDEVELTFTEARHDRQRIGESPRMGARDGVSRFPSAWRYD